jgi:predicted transcriptional regulator
MNNSVFMSIKEIHINRILNKTKNHEFRTKKPNNKFEYIIVYVPTPLKEIKYILRVKEPIATPNKILIDGYGNQTFNEENKEKYAYPIENVYEIKQPIGLVDLREKFNFTAPQSFAYGEKYKSLLDYIEKIGVKKLY